MAKGELTAKQQAAIASLLAGGTHAKAAAAAGVHANRITFWLRDPAFTAALRAEEAGRLEAITRALTTLAGHATAVLAAVLTDNRASPAVKIRAADVVLTKCLQLRELVDLEARIAALEEGMK